MSEAKDDAMIESVLNRSGVKATHQRREILRLLFGECRPMSAQELHEAVKGEGCDLVTVYRALEAFEKAEIVRRCDFADGVVRYEHSDESGEHHHHLICTKCKKVTPLGGDECVLDSFEKSVQKLGYVSIRHSLEFFGTCPECQKADASPSR
jgi:Fur family ferric uptake transcriptional regulator